MSGSPHPAARAGQDGRRVVLSTDGERILRANVQLVPDPTIPTDESGIVIAPPNAPPSRRDIR